MWWLLVVGIAPLLGVASALTVLVWSNFQSDFGLPGALIIAPLAILPLAGLLIVDRVAKPPSMIERLLGFLIFLTLAVFGEVLVGNWIESMHHS